jgi:hypothetical protein
MVGMIGIRFVLPEVAEHETRTLSTIIGGKVEDNLVFDEVYCADPACDCHRVIINVLSVRSRTQIATINHAFPGGDVDPQLGRTFLDPLNPQTDRSPEILQTFKDVILTKKYESRLREHYALFKRAIGDAGHPCHARLRESGIRVHRKSPPPRRTL